MGKLAIFGGDPVLREGAGCFRWPRVTSDMQAAVIRQLHESMSIYDRSGVFAEFEDAFRAYHQRRHALLFNSGTSAIMAMFEGAKLVPGDEVICPVYTFHASVSPLAYLGSYPVFGDVDEEGNLSLGEVQQLYTQRTRAVVVTHMWGVPVTDIVEMSQFCAERNVILVEDCSHAHGARIRGRLVGTFGDAAAWSLQGQKIVTGGEGGVMVTDNDELFERALLLGHYNKRPQLEIAPDSPNRRFYLTGMGLKLRAHPLAVAIALQQFRLLPEFLVNKRRHAQILIDATKDIPFLTPILPKDFAEPSWYALNFRFNAELAVGVTREQFVQALEAEGLVEVDIPGSTGLLHDQPLFLEPESLLPRWASTRPSDGTSQPSGSVTDFPKAHDLYTSLIKLPVWAYEDELSTVDGYAEGLNKVANHMAKYGQL